MAANEQVVYAGNCTVSLVREGKKVRFTFADPLDVQMLTGLGIKHLRSAQGKGLFTGHKSKPGQRRQGIYQLQQTVTGGRTIELAVDFAPECKGIPFGPMSTRFLVLKGGAIRVVHPTASELAQRIRANKEAAE